MKNTTESATTTATVTAAEAPLAKAIAKVAPAKPAKAVKAKREPKPAKPVLKPYKASLKVKTLKSGIVQITGIGTKEDYRLAMNLDVPPAHAQVNVLALIGKATVLTDVVAPREEGARGASKKVYRFDVK